MYSFSQNFEDVYIRRAFAGISDGFYIDAGAFDPVVDSVTKMLYDLGWSGINLEPGPSFPSFACRTRDINLPFALTAQEGKTTFHYNASDPGTSTAADSNRVDSPAVQSYQVSTTTLDAIIRAHCPGRHIHFLKLDIEGSEWDVLSSTDWRAVRPELILAESSEPYTNIRRDDGWAEHMASFGYEEVFFDGVNTYYLREESLFRRDAFNFPVNVLDGVRKFEPQQHHALHESESLAIIKKVSQEVVRSVEASTATARQYIETQLNDRLRAEEDRVAKLTAAQADQLARLRELAGSLPTDIGAAEGAPSNGDAKGLIETIARATRDLAAQRTAQEAQLADERVRQAALVAEQSARAEDAERSARVLTERLNTARASRLTLIDLTERLTTARLKESGEAAAANALYDREFERDLALFDHLGPHAASLMEARRVPPWRTLVPFGVRALVRQANASRDEGQWLAAARGYARAYALRPDRADLCLQMANMLTELGAFPLAELAYGEALIKAPDNGPTFLHLGHMLELSGRPLRARLAYLKARELMPDQRDIASALSRVEGATGIRRVA